MTQRQFSDVFFLALGALNRKLRRQLEQARARHTMASLDQCGDGVRLNGRCEIWGPDRLRIEDNVHIGNGAFIRAEGGVRIGANTHISRNLVLYSVNHRYDGSRLPYDERLVAKRVDIGRNVWIGMNVCIVPGTTIGDGAIVGMGTVVSGDVPPLAIVGSQPWRQVGQRDRAHYERLERDGAWGGPDGQALSS